MNRRATRPLSRSILGANNRQGTFDNLDQVDWLWILDVDGQRLAIDATCSPSTTEVDRAELRHVAESLRFKIP